MTNEKQKQRIIEKLRSIWYMYPQLRFNQLISKMVNSVDKDIFYLEDDEFEKLLDDFLK